MRKAEVVSILLGVLLAAAVIAEAQEKSRKQKVRLVATHVRGA
jgi:hypothetical protein